MRLPIQVQCIVYKQQNNSFEFLLLKRIPEKGGFWQAVTGGFEDSDESLITACIREIREETTIEESSIINRVDNVYFYQFPDDKNIVLSEYVFGFEVKPSVKVTIDSNIYPEHEELKWVSFDQGMKLLKWDNNKKALTKLHDRLTKK